MGVDVLGDGFTPAVSVIIPCRDALGVLPRQLEALGRQVDAPPFEVLVVDNRDNDGLEELLEGWRGRLPGVRRIDATAEPGTGYARNRGIVEARAAKLLFCDADDVVAPTWVADGARQLDVHPAFSGGAIPFAAQDVAAGWESVTNRLARELQSYVRREAAVKDADYPVLLGCSFGMTTEFARRIDGFDRAFGTQAEDNELAFRIRHELGTLPRAAHVCVAYRQRSDAEHSVRRSFKAGLHHAMVCARYDAWRVSPSFSGRWWLRPLKECFIRPDDRSWSDALFRLAGLIVGRVRFAHGRGVPAPRLGVEV